MSNYVMEYPPSWEDFAEQYSITDSEEVYTNGSKLVSLFRVHQMVKHYFAEPLSRPRVVRCRDCVYFDKYPNDEITVCYRFDNEEPEVAPDGFCAWGERR